MNVWVVFIYSGSLAWFMIGVKIEIILIFNKLMPHLGENELAQTLGENELAQ